MYASLFAASVGFKLLASVAGHATAWHPSMWGFNYSTLDGNRPQDPLMNLDFDQWWFHGHLSYPPHPTDWLEFPAGGTTTMEITCDKAATTYCNTNPGGCFNNGLSDDVCPGQPITEFHTNGPDDLKGCAMAIAYIPPSQVNTIKPEDFTIFSVNDTCVWNRFTDFQVPAKMPACPEGGCTCAWFWIHSSDSGSEQIYMNGYQCNITGATSTVPIAQPQLARRCGAEDDFDRQKAYSAGNCTYGPKQPLYWLQTTGDTYFEDPWHPPYYNELYNFAPGPQTDIFVDATLPTMTWAGAPTAPYATVAGTFTGAGSGPAATPTSSSASKKTSTAVVNVAPTPNPQTSSNVASPNMPSATSTATDGSTPSTAELVSPTDAPTTSSSVKKGHAAAMTVTVTETVTTTVSDDSSTETATTITPEEASAIVDAAATTSADASDPTSTDDCPDGKKKKRMPSSIKRDPATSKRNASAFAKHRRFHSHNVAMKK